MGSVNLLNFIKEGFTFEALVLGGGEPIHIPRRNACEFPVTKKYLKLY